MNNNFSIFCHGDLMLFFLNDLKGADFLIVAVSYILVIILSLSLHEFAHAFIAYKNGDSTPKIQGRVSMNPFKHIDPIGLICTAFFGFGWASPVQINPSNFRNVKRGIVWTSVAGVITNLILSFIGYGLFELTMLINSTNYFIAFIQQFFYFMYIINVSLAVFNFLPIYPLDGFKFVEALTKYNNKFVQFMYKYGYIVLILLLLVFDNLLFKLINIVSFPIEFFWKLIF